MAGRRRPRRLVPPVMLAARGHRKEPTPAEERLWLALRDGKLGGLNFRRQHPVGPFILDFYCPKKKLCIEVDGGIHDARREMDEARTEALGTLKIRVIRFRNEEVLDELSSVLKRIAAAADIL
jgi:very-short-patch-repair endonuclease